MRVPLQSSDARQLAGREQINGLRQNVLSKPKPRGTLHQMLQYRTSATATEAFAKASSQPGGFAEGVATQHAARHAGTAAARPNYAAAGRVSRYPGHVRGGPNLYTVVKFSSAEIGAFAEGNSTTSGSSRRAVGTCCITLQELDWH